MGFFVFAWISKGGKSMERDLSEVNWVNTGPPKKEKPKAPIKRPKTAQTVRYVLLDEQVTEVWTHWIGGRTQPCLGKSCECANWPPKQNQRWKGYLMALEKPAHQLVIVELTPEAFSGCAELQDRSRSLRGALLTLQRQGTQPNGRVKAAVQYSTSDNLKGSPVSVKEALWDVWFAEGESRLTQARIAGVGIHYKELEKEETHDEA
jgi:hypothetical protein